MSYIIEYSIFNGELTVSLIDGLDTLSVSLLPSFGDVFLFDGGKIQGNDCQLFVYAVDNNGTLEMALSPYPNLLTVAGVYRDDNGQTGAVSQSNIVMSGIRDANNTCAVVGRLNANQADNDEWQNPIINNVINSPIYETDWLKWTAQYDGFSTLPSGPLSYQLNRKTVTILTQPMGFGGVSDAPNFTISYPFISSSLHGFSNPCATYDNGFVTASGYIQLPASSRIGNIYKNKYGLNNFTPGAIKAAFGQMIYFID